MPSSTKDCKEPAQHFAAAQGACLQLRAAWLACSAGINAILIAWLGVAEEAAMQLNILALLQVCAAEFNHQVSGIRDQGSA